VTRCDFCDIDGFREHSALVRENDLCLFASGAAPEGETQSLLWGSGIIVPKAHRETVFDLLPDEFMATQDLLLEVRPLLDERHEPDGYTIGWNCFAASGQSIPHAHLHVLLRYSDEPLAGKGIRWFFRQPENLRPDPFSRGRGGTRFLGQAD
jgi:histidine triad (HIT) family protein